MTKENIYKKVSINPETVVKDLLEDPLSPIKVFNESLTKEERALGIANLSDDKKYEFIVALFNFQLKAIPYIDKCALKTQILFSNTLLKKNIKNFKLNVSFQGTIENVKSENFQYEFNQIENVEEYKKNEKEKEILEEERRLLEEQENETLLSLLEEGLNEDLEDDTIDEEEFEELKTFINEEFFNDVNVLTKFDMLINQKDVVLNIFKEIKEKLSDTTEKESCLATAGFLINAEFLSISNLNFQKAFYENLTDGEIQTNKSFEAKVTKNTVEFELTHIQNYSAKIH